MTITVTQEDIDSATANSCTLCPIALAVKRLFPGVEVLVSSASVHIKSGATFALSAEAGRFVRLFDLGHKVQPFSFQMQQVI